MLVGLPYANPTDPELAEHMKYLDSVKCAASSHMFAYSVLDSQGWALRRFLCTFLPGVGGPRKGRGRAQYEAMCMRAVNQSIGAPQERPLAASPTAVTPSNHFQRSTGRAFANRLPWR